MPRRLENWIEGYLDYASSTEAPRLIHFWAAVSAVAGSLRRRVWFDQVKFRWYPSFYIVFVGPPGIITKSTTADGSMDLLKCVPGIHFGPDAITPQQLVTSFADVAESYEFPPGIYAPMAALTYVASEFGNLIDFQDRTMVNLLITLWDGRNTYAKETKTSGSDMVEGPWVNILGCTTPRWIDDNMTANTIGGGFTSRCIFVYGDKKERPVAYIEDAITDRGGYDSLKEQLIHDLEWMATQLIGPFRLTAEAKEWGKGWYENLWASVYKLDNPDYINNYLARKQGHLHKLAIILSAAKRDDQIITLRDLQLADIMLTQTEESFDKVFSRVGKSEQAQDVEMVMAVLRRKDGGMLYSEFVRLCQAKFPDSRDIAMIVKSYSDGGQIGLFPGPGGTWIRWVGGAPEESLF